MKRIPMAGAKDRLETAAHAWMGLAAVLALTAFFASLLRVSEEAPRLAHDLERWQMPARDTLIAHGRTNTPSPPSGEPSRQPVQDGDSDNAETADGLVHRPGFDG